MNHELTDVRIGFQVYIEEGADPCGGVRSVAPRGRPEIVVYVENAGEFILNVDSARSVHEGKVVLDRERLQRPLLDAIEHAHDSEVPGL